MTDIHGYGNVLDHQKYFLPVREKEVSSAKPKPGTNVEVTFKGTVAESTGLGKIDEAVKDIYGDGVLVVEDEKGNTHLVQYDEYDTPPVFKVLETLENQVVYRDALGEMFLYVDPPAWAGQEPHFLGFGQEDNVPMDEPVRPLTKVG